MLLKDGIKYMSTRPKYMNSVVYDDFDREDNTKNAGVALTGQTWDTSMCTSAKWGILNGKLYCDSNSSKTDFPAIYIDDGLASKRITVDVTPYDSVSVIFRVNSGTNYFLFTIQSTVVRIRKVINNTWTTIAIKGESYTVGRTYKITIEDTGTSISVFLNDILKLTVNDNSLNDNTKTGIRLGSASIFTTMIDNYYVEPL